MITVEYVKVMAAYSCWQNDSIYGAADSLTDSERRKERGAFFGSIQATLNHLLWGDQLWLERFGAKCQPRVTDIPSSTDQYKDWPDIMAARQSCNDILLDWSEGVSAPDLEGELCWYSGAMGREVCKPRALLITHMFNHGTHHRGQVHAMLTAAGAKPDDTDMPFMPENL